MSSYCLTYRKYTESKNSKVVKTNKKTFIKVKKAKGFLSCLGI